MRKIYESEPARRRAEYHRAKARKLINATPDVIDSIPEIDIAYIAGLVDGEGTIFVARMSQGRQSFYPTIAVDMTDRPVIEWLARILGAAVSQPKRRSQIHRPSFVVRLSGKRAKLLCRRMIPHAKVKREHMRLVLDFPSDNRMGPGALLSKETRARQIMLRDSISALNARHGAHARHVQKGGQLCQRP